MPIYLYSCQSCLAVHERFYKMADKPQTVECPDCGGACIQKPCVGLVKGDEAAWLDSVAVVVDKNGGEHCQRFLQDRTRANYQAWMKGEGLRPLEDGEKVRRPTVQDRKAERKQIVDKIVKQRYEERKVVVK